MLLNKYQFTINTIKENTCGHLNVKENKKFHHFTTGD